MTNLKRAGVVAVASVLFLAPMFGKASAPGTLNEQVTHKLRGLTYYTVFDNIQFRVDNGTVILFGQVTQPVLKIDAEREVKDLEGVKVRDEIEVLPLSRMDDQIRVVTYRAIYGSSPLQHYGVGLQNLIHIIVKNGNVTLTGVVGTESDKQLAYLQASRVPGVFAVTNELAVAR